MKSLESVHKLMLEMKRECEISRLVESVYSYLTVKLMNLLTQMERYLEESGMQEMQSSRMHLWNSFPG